MKGMGADAFFEQPIAAKTPLPAKQQTSEPVKQDTGAPASQQNSTTAQQHTVKPARQSDSMPGLVKATFYLTDADILCLEQVRLERKRRGMKVDKSALVREAIKMLHA